MLAMKLVLARQRSRKFYSKMFKDSMKNWKFTQFIFQMHVIDLFAKDLWLKNVIYTTTISNTKKSAQLKKHRVI